MSQDARTIEENSTRRRATILGLEYHNTAGTDKQLYKELMTFEQMQQMRVVPLSANKQAINFGVTNNTSQQTFEKLRHTFLDQRLRFYLISDAGFREYMKLYNPPKKVEYHDIEIKGEDTEQIIKRVSDTLNQVRADDMLAYLVQQAHKLGASDIHLENQEEEVRIRFRIDGVLHPVARLSKERCRLLMSAIASAGNISTAADAAQQGHIHQKGKMADGADVDVNVRLETVPTINGMDAVMRLFNMDAERYKLDRLGLSSAQREVVDGIISRPSGLVLAVGPTGSGKTTTLYSMLNSLNSDERKIITIEDPVEFQFPGVVQLSVNSKSGQEQGFAERLRAVLRLDPDIVMVGEIRDMDTAKTALQASLTGHLVLSTFHASSAAAALTRLLDIIESNPLYLSAIRLVMAQRLVRRLDPDTKVAYQPSQEEIELIQQVFSTLPERIEPPDLSNLQLYKPGSSADNPFGYKGQVAIREQFTVNDHVREILSSQKGLSTQEIENAAVQSGMITMLHDGMLQVVKGETTLEEVYRVVG
ncbi:MAG: GspE/PulE family protein [Candidatus Saccharibacteria bacterium]|nr:GspE/PulE family protein [Candidatus Saccharibacteria bacterium]